MKTIKTSDLIGDALDWVVTTYEQPDHTSDVWRMFRNECHYSTNWAHGGPIIEREWLEITPWPNESREEMRWHCQQHDSGGDCAQYGPTPLIAAMRCYVASMFGDEVEVPEDLK